MCQDSCHSRITNERPLLRSTIELATTYVVVCFSLTHMVSPSILLSRERESISINPNYSTGMFSFVQAGVNSVPKDSKAFFVHPVDIPMVYPSTIKKIIDRHDAHEGTIIYPCYKGNRGHPPLVPSRFSKAIIRANISGKLNDVLASFVEDSMDLEAEDPNILFYMNHPRDYAAMVSGLDHCSVLIDGQT